MKKLITVISAALSVVLGALVYSSVKTAAQCNGVFPANTLCGNLTASPKPPAAFSATTSVIGPGSSTINDLAAWANTTGNQLKDMPISTGLSVSGVTSSLILLPSALAVIGGVKAVNPVTHQWINSIDTTGTPSLTQPLFADVSGTLAASQYTDQQHSITSVYTVATSDCGQRIQAGGGLFYTITIGAAGGFSGGCLVKITNTDPMPTGANSTGAKLISVNGINGCTPAEPSTYLWPTQTMEIANVGGTSWEITRCPGLWVVPSGTFTVNVDPASGSDTWGAADGLNVTSRAFASYNNAMLTAAELFQQQFLSQTQLTFKCAANCVDNGTNIHWPPHGSPLNAQGRQGVEIDCNNGTLTNQVQLFFGAAIVFFQNCSMPGGISLTEGAEAVLNGSNNTFTPVNAGFIFAMTAGAKLFCNTCTINLSPGTGSGMFNLTAGSTTNPGTAINVNQTGNVTWTDTGIRVQSGSIVTIGTWTTNAHTTSGSIYKLVECGILEGAANLPQGNSSSFSCTQVN